MRLALAIALCLTLIGCGNPDPNPSVTLPDGTKLIFPTGQLTVTDTDGKQTITSGNVTVVASDKEFFVNGVSTSRPTPGSTVQIDGNGVIASKP